MSSCPLAVHRTEQIICPQAPLRTNAVSMFCCEQSSARSPPHRAEYCPQIPLRMIALSVICCEQSSALCHRTEQSIALRYRYERSPCPCLLRAVVRSQSTAQSRVLSSDTATNDRTVRDLLRAVVRSMPSHRAKYCPQVPLRTIAVSVFAASSRPLAVHRTEQSIVLRYRYE